MTLQALAIGEVSRRAGVKVTTIRFYEQIGLLPVASRTGSNRRQYDTDDVRRLAFIRHARALGFEIDAIRTLLTLQDDLDQPCSTADAIAKARLEEVEQRITSLAALRAELELMIEGCGHGRLVECNVIGVLADNAKCSHPRH